VSPVEIVHGERYGTPRADLFRNRSLLLATFILFTKLESGFCPMAEVNGPDFSKSELLPAIAQDSSTGEVLMMAWMNREAYEETLRTGRVCYFSRSRQKLWRKGEESGNVQELHAIYFDCDGDTLLVKVRQIGGAACHEGYSSCFFRRIDAATQAFTVEGVQVFDPKSVYGK
jgi:phosphoribosyl-AMP cyclohydrolase